MSLFAASTSTACAHEGAGARTRRITTLTHARYLERKEKFDLVFGIHSTPFGEALFLSSPFGLCRLSFVEVGGIEQALERARADWPGAALVEDQTATAAFAEMAFADVRARRSVPLLLKGSPFELRVWQALLAIPDGEVRSYGDIAVAIGAPGAQRAVGRACARNPVGWLVPCHRVICADGSLGGFGWGLERKRAMLAFEGVAGCAPQR